MPKRSIRPEADESPRTVEPDMPEQVRRAALALGGEYAAALDPAWRPDPAAWSDEALRAEREQLRALCAP